MVGLLYISYAFEDILCSGFKKRVIKKRLSHTLLDYPIEYKGMLSTGTVGQEIGSCIDRKERELCVRIAIWTERHRRLRLRWKAILTKMDYCR